MAGNKSNPLQTQRDGRLFAVTVLERLDRANADHATAYPYQTEREPGEKVSPYRTGPQWDGFYRDLSRLIRRGSDEAVKGFSTIVTDALASDINVSTSLYRELESEGRILDFGTPGKKYRQPRVMSAEAMKRAKRESERVAEENDKEKRPNPATIQQWEPEAIEKFLAANKPTRWAATTFLTVPYAKTARDVKKDKDYAKAWAAAAEAIRDTLGYYFTVCSYLSQAERNMRAAVRTRRDGEKLLKAAKRSRNAKPSAGANA